MRETEKAERRKIEKETSGEIKRERARASGGRADRGDGDPNDGGKKILFTCVRSFVRSTVFFHPAAAKTTTVARRSAADADSRNDTL